MYMIFGFKAKVQKHLSRQAVLSTLCLFCLLFTLHPIFSQNRNIDSYTTNTANSTNPAASQYANRLKRGVDLYRESRWKDAVLELRGAQAEAANTRQRSEALYWIALAELSDSDYESALKTMDALENSGGSRTIDIAYHRGRAYYYLGYYEEAIILLNEYATKTGEDEKARISSAYYWIGESLFALGQFDRARFFFQTITEQYPESVKYEASSYRISLINQKKVETELLALLKWSHEESLKTIEEYRRRERTYDQALNSYQRQIAERERDTRLTEMETANTEYRRQIDEAQERIRSLEKLLESMGIVNNTTTTEENLRIWAMQLRGEMEQNVRNIENSDGGVP